MTYLSLLSATPQNLRRLAKFLSLTVDDDDSEQAHRLLADSIDRKLNPPRGWYS